VYNKIKFKNFIPQSILQSLRNNKSIQIVYNCVEELLTAEDIENITQAMRAWGPHIGSITVLVGDNIQKQFLHQKIYDSSPFLLRHLNILVFNWFIVNIGNIACSTKSTKRFSLLCRRHRPWRTYLINQLYERKLLEYFYFSYLGVSNDEEMTTDMIEQDLKNIKVNISNEFRFFLQSRPYYLGSSEVDLYKVVPDSAIQSDIHLVIEHAKFDEDNSAESPQFVSEKTYKAIMSKKPFIALSSPGFLSAVRSLGYQTFSAWIDESYDLETDAKTRINMITDEVARIAALPELEYNQLIKNCYEIAEHNYKHAIEILNRNGLG
jgi:GR25 family glycosyltransferase involved in LPS biosynthesis